MKKGKKVITTIFDLKTNQEYTCTGTQFGHTYKVRCLGNYGPADNKVYLTRLPSKETPESMKTKFKKNVMPNCFVCWDFMLNKGYIITK